MIKYIMTCQILYTYNEEVCLNVLFLYVLTIGMSYCHE